MSFLGQVDPAMLLNMMQSQPQTSSSPLTMPAQTQEIYNYLYPTGDQTNSSVGSYDPTQTNINANYTGPSTANPLQPSYLSTPTQGQATMSTAAQLGQGVSPQVMSMLSPQAAEQQLYNAFQPAQATATGNLNNTLASMGLQGGPAIQAQQQLQQQLTSGLGNSLSSLISGAQGNQLSALNTQAGLNQQTGLANQSAANTMTSQNLGNLYNANQYNATAANDANSAYTNQLIAAYQANMNNFQNMNNAGYTGTTNLAGSQLTGSQNLAGQEVNNYPVYGGAASAFSNLGSSLGSAGGATQSYDSGGLANAAGSADMSSASFGGY